MVFPQFSDFPQTDVLDIRSLPTNLRSPAALVAGTEEEAELASLVSHYGSFLLLPEYWQHRFPQAGVLISSAISGGTFRQRLESAMQIAPGRCWLLLEPICMQFSLPCTDGTGSVISSPPADKAFFSEALCCYYTHSCKQEHAYFTLFDTEASLNKKVAMARNLGFCGFVSL